MDLLPEEIAAELDLKVYQGRQIYRWLHQKQVSDFDAMTNLSKDLRRRLGDEAAPSSLEEAHVSRSSRARGTKKLLFRLRDGETVESVLIRDGERATLCLSSQVGCAIKCTFCATGHSGYTRNLSPGEIAEQALRLLEGEDSRERSPNVVYMGMGEPFRNYDAVIKSIRLLMAKDGLNLGARRITVSTAGDVPGINRFAQENRQVRLSVSLHAANDALRSELVPLNRKYPLPALIAAVNDYIAQTGRQVTFEWALLKDTNDSEKDADELLILAQKSKAHVNLIPYNPVAGLAYERPADSTCAMFARRLEAGGVSVTLRKERGQDIDAACGQLRRRASEAT